MTPETASNASALLGLIVTLGNQLVALQSTLQAAMVAGRDITDAELDAARADAQLAADALAKA